MMRRLSILALLAALLTLGLALPSPGPAAQGVQPSFFGVIPIQQLEPQEFEKLKDAGVGTVRVPVIWQFVEPSPDAYDWGQIDYYVTAATQNGVRILPFLYSTPKWAAGGCTTATKCQNNPPLTQQGREAWQDFLRDFAGRYGPGGTFWQEHPELTEQPITDFQIWNEPSSPTYWEKPSAGKYAELVKLSHDTITQVVPDARIVLAGLFGTPQGKAASRNVMWKYLNRLYGVQGISDSFDAVSLHPYARNLRELKFQLNKARKIMVQAGDGGKELLVTEIGWGSAKPEGDRPLLKGKKGQARLLTQSYNFLLDNRSKYNIGAVIWYAWRDPDHDIEGCEFCSSSGLFTLKGKEKPAWDKLVNIAGGTP
jgi:hypothetical protein